LRLPFRRIAYPDTLTLQRVIFWSVGILLCSQVAWWITLSFRESRRLQEARIATLKAGRALDVGLGVRQMTDHPGIYEYRFSAGGRATFNYGSEARGANAYVIWRRIGGHEIYREP